jgi:hypothetical protein
MQEKILEPKIAVIFPTNALAIDMKQDSYMICSHSFRRNRVQRIAFMGTITTPRANSIYCEALDDNFK